ncbi:MAG: hypothetical protein DMF77_22070 [Acidobacteria bacterium]|nr:MAG: hypothetical protein DMF77_22070 [Acidobacteriota bacterium]
MTNATVGPMASRARKAPRPPLPAAIATASPPRASTTRPGVQYAQSHSAARPRLAEALPENDVSLSRKAIAPASSSVLRKKSHSGYATTVEARAKARAKGPRAARRARAKRTSARTGTAKSSSPVALDRTPSEIAAPRAAPVLQRGSSASRTDRSKVIAVKAQRNASVSTMRS